MRYLIFILLCFSCTAPLPEDPQPINGSVASAHPLATEAGMEILKAGGNAFDAAVAVASTLNVVEPMMSGIGGYGTTLIYDAKENQIRFLNSSGRFPIKTNTDFMRPPTEGFMENRVGPKSISTPGNLNAWADMHAQYGQLPWDSLFISAIKYAEHGFAISAITSRMIEIAFEDFDPYVQGFYGKNGSPLQPGDTLIQKDLGQTFRQIVLNGPEIFYQGTIAKAIDAKMQEIGSFLSLEDLKNNEAEWWEPLKMTYRDYDVYTAHLPSNAFAAFVNLGLMKQFSIGSLQHNSSEYLHLFAEMTKESYKARLAYSFDPEVREAPLDSIFSERVLGMMANALDKDQASIFTPPFQEESKNTTHFVVADRWGNVVSATQTLGNLFGSRIMVEGTGVWLNNSMAYSTFEPKGNPMDAFPGRRKLSGDCPIIIMKKGAPWAALGSPGGHTITQNVPQIIINLIDFGMTMQEAIDAPKISFVEPDKILVDDFLEQALMDSLKARGHHLITGKIGNAHGIRILRDSTGAITGYETGIDRRRER